MSTSARLTRLEAIAEQTFAAVSQAVMFSDYAARALEAEQNRRHFHRKAFRKSGAASPTRRKARTSSPERPHALSQELQPPVPLPLLHAPPVEFVGEPERCALAEQLAARLALLELRAAPRPVPAPTPMGSTPVSRPSSPTLTEAAAMPLPPSRPSSPDSEAAETARNHVSGRPNPSRRALFNPEQMPRLTSFFATREWTITNIPEHLASDAAICASRQLPTDVTIATLTSAKVSMAQYLGVRPWVAGRLFNPALALEPIVDHRPTWGPFSLPIPTIGLWGWFRILQAIVFFFFLIAACSIPSSVSSSLAATVLDRPVSFGPVLDALASTRAQFESTSRLISLSVNDRLDQTFHELFFPQLVEIRMNTAARADAVNAALRSLPVYQALLTKQEFDGRQQALVVEKALHETLLPELAQIKAQALKLADDLLVATRQLPAVHDLLVKQAEDTLTLRADIDSTLHQQIFPKLVEIKSQSMIQSMELTAAARLLPEVRDLVVKQETDAITFKTELFNELLTLDPKAHFRARSELVKKPTGAFSVFGPAPVIGQATYFTIYVDETGWLKAGSLGLGWNTSIRVFDEHYVVAEPNSLNRLKCWESPPLSPYAIRIASDLCLPIWSFKAISVWAAGTLPAATPYRDTILGLITAAELNHAANPAKSPYDRCVSHYQDTAPEYSLETVQRKCAGESRKVPREFNSPPEADCSLSCRDFWDLSPKRRQRLRKTCPAYKSC